MFSWSYFLTNKVATLGDKIRQETTELNYALSRADFDATKAEPHFLLKNLSESLNELSFVRTELLLAAERKKRRTM